MVIIDIRDPGWVGPDLGRPCTCRPGHRLAVKRLTRSHQPTFVVYYPFRDDYENPWVSQEREVEVGRLVGRMNIIPGQLSKRVERKSESPG